MDNRREHPEEVPEEELSREDVRERDDNSQLDYTGKRIPQPYHKRYYLLYGGSSQTEPMDLNGTKSFLQAMGFDGGELRQARCGRNYAERIAEEENRTHSETNMFCAYCGTEITGVGYNRLPDGRLRCTTCSSTLVRTREELKSIYDRVRLQMEVFYGATFNVPIEIQFLEERKLKKKLNLSIGEIDNKSLLVLGVAVKEKKNYSVYLENGAPRMSVIATLVHELTHIWQYTHWEGQPFAAPVPREKHLLIYEGMAKWSEIQYLYLIGETAVARREEIFTRKRNDEYGIGFSIYADQYPLTREAMTCAATPFVTDHCPIE